jgi:hypothetical protein
MVWQEGKDTGALTGQVLRAGRAQGVSPEYLTV